MDIGKFRIHIAPVGYEIDRIVIPAKNLKADKVYLLIDNKETEDKAKKFIIEIEAQLKKANIRVEKIKHHTYTHYKQTPTHAYMHIHT